MSGHGQGQGGQGGQGGGQGQAQGGKPQDYYVKTDFTDDKGKHWTVGTKFTGEPEAVRKALAAGQIEQKPAA